MKKILLVSAILAVTAAASAQVKSQSVDYGVSSNGVSVLYLRDGLNNNYKAFTYDFAPVKLNGKGITGLSFAALGALDNTSQQVYLGTGLSYKLYSKNGFAVTLLGGYKGFNLSDNLAINFDRNNVVVGVGITIPLGK